MQSRRPSLNSIQGNKAFHPGLWLDKYLVEQRIEEEYQAGSPQDQRAKSARSAHLKAIEKPSCPGGYREAFERWKASWRGTERLLVEGKVEGRMIVGLGDKNPLEMGITLQHTWGTPYIPGSALKGLASATAHRLIKDKDWQRTTAQDSGKTEAASHRNEAENSLEEKAEAAQFSSADILFGTTERMGAVIFHDAWWIPKGAGEVPLFLDVMTVHHLDYYQAKKDGPTTIPPPSDTDNPNPVSFLSVGGSYLIVLEGEKAWCEAAYQLLKIGLEELGVGAKTSSGYGRLSLGEPTIPRLISAEDWAKETYPKIFEQDDKAQYKQLVELQASPPAFPSELQEGDCKQALAAHFAKGVELAKVYAKGQSDGSTEALENELAEHTKEQNKPNKKKDEKAFKKWEKEKGRLETQLKNSRDTEKNVPERQRKAKSLLAWLGVDNGG